MLHEYFLERVLFNHAFNTPLAVFHEDYGTFYIQLGQVA